MRGIIIIFGFSCLIHAQGKAETSSGHDVAYEKTIEFKVSRKKGGKYKLSSRVKISTTYLSDRSTRVTRYQIYEPYFGRVSKIKAKLRDKGVKGNRISSRTYDRGDVFIGDDKLHTISFPANIQVGDKASYSYKMDYRDATYLPLIRIPNKNFLKSFKITIEHPKEISAEFDIFFSRGEIDYKITHPDTKHTVITFDSLEWAKPLVNFPFNDFRAVVLIALLDNGSPINPVSVAGFADWYLKLDHPSPDLSNEQKGLMRDRLDIDSGVMALLAKIHTFARDSIRYIADVRGDHAIVPYAPSVVFDRKYGDCKDRANLVCAMARDAGIEVHMAVISSSEVTPALNGTHVSQYDHVICAYYDDSLGTVFFDPTATYCEFGNLPDYLIGKKALILDPENPRLLKVQATSNSVSIEMTISASIDSLESGTATVTLRNGFYSSVLRAKRKLKGIDFENHLSNLILSRFHKIELDSFRIVDETDGMIMLNANADLSSFIISSPTKTYIPRVPFLVMDRRVLEREDDSLPVYFESRANFMLTLNLAKPNYATVSDSLVLTDNEIVSFRSALILSDSDHVNIIYEFERQTKFVAAQSKSEFLSFCRDYFANKKSMFILKEVSP